MPSRSLVTFIILSFSCVPLDISLLCIFPYTSIFESITVEATPTSPQEGMAVKSLFDELKQHTENAYNEARDNWKRLKLDLLRGISIGETNHAIAKNKMLKLIRRVERAYRKIMNGTDENYYTFAGLYAELTNEIRHFGNRGAKTYLKLRELLYYVKQNVAVMKGRNMYTELNQLETQWEPMKSRWDDFTILLIRGIDRSDNPTAHIAVKELLSQVRAAFDSIVFRRYNNYEDFDRAYGELMKISDDVKKHLNIEEITISLEAFGSFVQRYREYVDNSQQLVSSTRDAYARKNLLDAANAILRVI
ncbi:uncharacterized protein LOC106640641 [Copidosoma floridanum]|uniref:uncharacterized protein LOC106640641 n=1 Tax=Copidosoma floridanum TaxID=29053 RepID=UPI0006C95118|nr:uncharacterized protein LOC106640641 [Copidosoma floridanum]